MSRKNGDKARTYRAQQKKLIRRKRVREMLAKTAAPSQGTEAAPAE